jgi:endonuclease YncB( thermonuclease family)
MLALAAIVAFAVSRTGWLEAETGRFTAVDGDSLRKGEQDYRLHGIDAPELHQTCTGAGGKPYACGRKARDQLRSLVSGETIACDILETDRYGRLVATCRAGQTDINRAMVLSGWATAYRRHGTDYADAEAEARKAGRGVWQGRFETPERWRERHRNDIVRSDMGAVPFADD